jgi:dipeptidyl aminopeptidase/acylaminoacyl peptidase
MPKTTTAPYGSWKSPISSEALVAETIGVSAASLDGDGICWQESRPSDKGRNVVVRRDRHGAITDLTPAPFNVRTRVHEYGGGAYVAAAGSVFFANFADQRVYRLDAGQPARPITPEAACRYADFSVDSQRGLLFCVREDHRGKGEAVNTLATLKLDGDPVCGTAIACGKDFYASPRLSPDGSQLAWLSWSHPDMPWDGTELWVADVAADGSLSGRKCVAGSRGESVFQPQWSPAGSLYFVSDRTGFWNLYRVRDGAVQALCPMQAEFGEPQWVFGQSTYAFESEKRLVCAYSRRGMSTLASLDTETLELQTIETPFTWITSVRAAPAQVLMLAGSPMQEASVCLLDLQTKQIEVLRRGSALRADVDNTSAAQAIEFPTEDGLTAHGLFYAPRNRDFEAPAGERPPLLVMSHGGPTSAAYSVWKAAIQFWTSRGIAVLDVNYGGSSGYGRAYRQRLNGRWGIVDVDDCVNGALYLARRAEVDGNRLMIRGGSAGGFTTLCALTFRDVFRCGASHYGVGDLEALAKDTHKFESRYLDHLVGPYPERRDLYVARSAIHHTDQMTCPLILFQGSQDAVVPPAQSRTMYEALKAKGIAVAYLEFEGEQHGFRKAENIQRALDAEQYFYAKVFGFALADTIEPVSIDNL